MNGPINRDLFRAENVTSIWGINPGHFEVGVHFFYIPEEPLCPPMELFESCSTPGCFLGPQDIGQFSKGQDC